MVALAPVGVLIGLHGGERAEHILHRPPVRHGAQADDLAVGYGDFQKEASHQHLENIVILCRIADLLVHDVVDYSGAVHGMDYHISDTEHLRLLPCPCISPHNC
ncbi:hypothetical protein SDC9_98145 [bioreactor metagenome]|uniref:Uncharacterized protein n=1 Tax=bioreactor metagenome TaxID=1076179 RepID=A0A645AEE7_9ZZZZ